MKRTPSPQNQEPDQEIIDLLKRLESHKVEYPPELLAARRADFLVQLKQARSEKIRQALGSNGQFTKHLKELQAVKADYPAKLLAARRAAFIAQVEEHNAAQVADELAPKDQEILQLFKAIKSAESEDQYPAKLMASRRSAFRRQIALGGAVSFLESWRASIRKLFQFKVQMPAIPMASLMRTSLIIAVLMVAAFATSLLRNREPVLGPASSQENAPQPVSSPTVTNTAGIITIVCQPGDESALCPPEELENSQDLAAQGNGEAKPAVASGNGDHKASNVNDGQDGGGWVSNSAYSWIKIDLGKVETINTVTLDKASLGSNQNRKLGQFVIAVALQDVYADGNSSNDYTEYTQVYDSEQTNFSGVVSDTVTIRAMFRPVRARFVKITFQDAGTAINEVKVFMAQPFGFAETSTRKPKEDSPASQATPIPVFHTPVPADTAIPAPTNTAIPAPTRTPVPTDPPPTRTPRPTDPPPTRTPRPPTSTPAPTDTDIPPTDIPPTDIPPTDIPPTDIPPADTPNSLAPVETPPPGSGTSTQTGGS